MLKILILSVLAVAMIGVMIPNAFGAYYDPVENKIMPGYLLHDGSIMEEKQICGSGEYFKLFLEISDEESKEFCWPNWHQRGITQENEITKINNCQSFVELELSGKTKPVHGTSTMLPYSGDYSCLFETKNGITAFIRYPVMGENNISIVINIGNGETNNSPPSTIGASKRDFGVYHITISKNGSEIYNQLEQDKKYSQTFPLRGIGGMMIPFAGVGTYDFTITVDSQSFRDGTVIKSPRHATFTLNIDGTSFPVGTPVELIKPTHVSTEPELTSSWSGYEWYPKKIKPFTENDLYCFLDKGWENCVNGGGSPLIEFDGDPRRLTKILDEGCTQEANNLISKEEKLHPSQREYLLDSCPLWAEYMVQTHESFVTMGGWSVFTPSKIISDYEPEPEPEPEPTTTQSSKGGGCLIATAAFGSEMAPQVQFLREIRDNTVMSTQSGTAFMTGFNQFYYSFSPQIADYERENPFFKETVKMTLTPLLTSLTLLNYVEIDSEEEMLGYGIGTILLNVGMYFVAPAVLIIALKNRLKK